MVLGATNVAHNCYRSFVKLCLSNLSGFNLIEKTWLDDCPNIPILFEPSDEASTRRCTAQ